jgi:hypothetical protein
MAELNYPQFVYEDEIWVASQQALICKFIKAGADINKYPVRYHPIVKNNDCATFMAEYEAFKAAQAKSIKEAEAKQIQEINDSIKG